MGSALSVHPKGRLTSTFTLTLTAFFGAALSLSAAQGGAKNAEFQEAEHRSNRDFDEKEGKGGKGSSVAPLPKPPAGSLIFGRKVTPAFQKKVIEIAKDLGTDPNFLMAIMEFESGGTFSPSVTNAAGSGAVGLIQFTERTAHGLGTSTAALKKMTAEEQLVFVHKHFAPHKGHVKSIDDAYMAVLFPAAIGKASDFVLFSKERNPLTYKQNQGLDKHPTDGKVTKTEAAAPVRAAHARGVKELTAANTAARPTARTDALFKTRHQHNLARAKKGDVDVLFLGDSITQGWESTGKDVFKKNFGTLKTANFGIGSDRTQNVLWRITTGKELEGINPKVVVLLIGTNNIGSNRPAEIAEGVQAIMKAIHAHSSDTKILLMTIFPRGAHGSDNLRKQVKETNTAILKFASSPKIFFVELNPEFVDAKGNLRKDMLPDLVHPSARGYTLWADAIREPLRSMLSETTASNLSNR